MAGNINQLKGEEFENKADKIIKHWFYSGSRSKDAAQLYGVAARFYKLAKLRENEAAMYVKMAECLTKCSKKYEAVTSYVEAGNLYYIFSSNEAISCFEKVVDLLMQMDDLNMAVLFTKHIAEIYAYNNNLEKSIVYYNKVKEISCEEAISSTNICNKKIAEFDALLKRYLDSVNKFEELAAIDVQNANELYLNAGLCLLCEDDAAAIANALNRYEVLNSCFEETCQYRFLADLAVAVEEKDVNKFNNIHREFDSITRLDILKTTLLLRIREKLKRSVIALQVQEIAPSSSTSSSGSMTPQIYCPWKIFDSPNPY